MNCEMVSLLSRSESKWLACPLVAMAKGQHMSSDVINVGFNRERSGTIQEQSQPKLNCPRLRSRPIGIEKQWRGQPQEMYPSTPTISSRGNFSVSSLVHRRRASSQDSSKP